MRPEDRAVAARDPALPGLALLLDDAAAEAALRERLPVAVRAARSTYIRYKPGTNCVVAFELDTAEGSRLAYGRTEHAQDQAKLHKAHENAPSGTVLLDDPPVAFLLFPNDRRLRSLRALMATPATVLAYKPERRLVVRRGETLLKAYEREGFAAARAAAAALPAGLPVQRCLDSRTRRSALVFSWVDGHPLDAELEAPDVATRVAAAVDALDALHGAAPTGALPRRTRATEAAALAVAAEGTAVAGPGVARAARRLAEHLAAELPAEPTVPHLLHGDFSIDQVVTGDAGAVLIDLDAACLGDPRLDLGSLLADLELRALDGRLASPAAEAAAAMFAGENTGAMRLFAAAGLLRRAGEPFRRRCPGWDALVEQAVERAAALTRSRRRALHRPAGAGAAAMPRDAMLASLHQIAPPPGIAADGPLTLRRASPRPDGRLLLEYMDDRGRIVGAQAGLDGDAIAAEQRLATRAGVPVPHVATAGHRTAAASGRPPGILLHVAGADGRLPALHPLLERPEARLLAHRATRRAVVALGGTAYVKAVRPSRAGAVAAATTAAAGLAARAFSVPAVLGADTIAGTVRYSPLPGRRLTDLLSTPAGADAMAALGAALRSLHAAPPPACVALHDAAREVDVVARATEAVAPYAPGLAVRASRAAATIERQLTRLAPVVPVPVHRDLHDKQVLVAPGGGLGLLDFDTLALGDPALDLGNLLAHLDLRALQGRCSNADAERLAAALLDGYRADSGVVARAAAYADATRVRLACVYAFRPAWPAVPEQLLAAT